jgi:organic hydroperoxide reductase OsmC/OhrA
MKPSTVMQKKVHQYKIVATWTGNTGQGTKTYRGYERSVTVSADNKADLLCTSDTAFNSDKTKHNPEELLLASISTCHLLWYLHLCSEAGVTVTAYIDNPIGLMQETPDGGGHFTEVTLYPTITVSDPSMVDKAVTLHKDANRLCYIANSCNFPIHHKPIVNVDASKEQ